MAVFAYLCGVLVALVVGLGAAQECYYPNGNLAPSVEKPCSSAPGSACCPEKWVCMDNGLCHYEPENLYGRHDGDGRRVYNAVRGPRRQLVLQRGRGFGRVLRWGACRTAVLRTPGARDLRDGGRKDGIECSHSGVHHGEGAGGVGSSDGVFAVLHGDGIHDADERRGVKGLLRIILAITFTADTHALSYIPPIPNFDPNIESTNDFPSPKPPTPPTSPSSSPSPSPSPSSSPSSQ
ncbi:hypothetical protein GRF29_164g1498336 [Pseudopithomyces chartarum]|uniref:Uncharacterized protein n=1 Tax=Pseudopithomyces chartarum TaxID=1892770 RepID=A0AAN6LQ80_9PLEO|nr:hypothetical protein GRF29_164g1498336 [Pseudopithomyces chartarum]